MRFLFFVLGFGVQLKTKNNKVKPKKKNIETLFFFLKKKNELNKEKQNKKITKSNTFHTTILTSQRPNHPTPNPTQH